MARWCFVGSYNDKADHSKLCAKYKDLCNKDAQTTAACPLTCGCQLKDLRFNTYACQGNRSVQTSSAACSTSKPTGPYTSLWRGDMLRSGHIVSVRHARARTHRARFVLPSSSCRPGRGAGYQQPYLHVSLSRRNPCFTEVSMFHVSGK